MAAFAAPGDPHRPPLAPVVEALAAVYAAHPDCDLTTRVLTVPWVSRARASDVLPSQLYNETVFWLVYAVHRADGALAKCEGTLPVDPPRAAAGCKAAGHELEQELAAAQAVRGWGAHDAAEALLAVTGRWTEGTCVDADPTAWVERCNCGGVDVPSIWPEDLHEPTCPKGCTRVAGPPPQPDRNRWSVSLGRSWRAKGTGRAPPPGRAGVARALSRCPEANERGVVFELLGAWFRMPAWQRDLPPSPWPLGDTLPSPSACAIEALARWAEPGAWVRLSSLEP
jgi:hypothetical protein